MIYSSLPKEFNPEFEVVSCYLEHDEEILLLHRHGHKSEGNKWGVPAGKIDKGENEFEAMVRETREETGQEISSDQFEYLSKVYVKYPDYHFVYYMFRVKLNERPLIVLSEGEHQDYKWVSPEAALSLELVRDLDACILMTYNN